MELSTGADCDVCYDKSLDLPKLQLKFNIKIFHQKTLALGLEDANDILKQTNIEVTD